MLRVGMQFWTLCVLVVTQSVTKCIPTLERGGDSRGYFSPGFQAFPAVAQKNVLLQIATQKLLQIGRAHV